MHEQPRKLFTQTLFIGACVCVFWGGFFSLEVSCKNLRFSAVACALPMLEIPGGGGESAKIGGFLQKSAFWLVTLIPSPSQLEESRSLRMMTTNVGGAPKERRRPCAE